MALTSRSVLSITCIVSVSWSTRALRRANSEATRAGSDCSSAKTLIRVWPWDDNCATFRSVSKIWWSAPLRKASSGSMVCWIPESSWSLVMSLLSSLGGGEESSLGLGQGETGRVEVGLKKGTSVGE